MTAIPIVVIAVFMSLAALHLYWGFGGRWPGRDADSLRLMVAGTPRGPMYGLGPCAMVAGALTSAAVVVWLRHAGALDQPIGWIIVAGYFVLVAVFGWRGLAPYFTSVFNYSRGTPFFDLNRRFYAPLCIGLAIALIVDHPWWPQGV